MNCDKCNHKLEMHYKLFCPKCDTDILIKKSNVVGDLFKIMYHMEANGYMSKDRFWSEWFTESFDFTNDTYVDMALDDTYDNEEINRYMRRVAELMGVKVGEYVIMWISW